MGHPVGVFSKIFPPQEGPYHWPPVHSYLAGGGLSVALHVLLALLADGRRVGLALLLELGPAVRALHHGERPAALLKLNLINHYTLARGILDLGRPEGLRLPKSRRR